MRINFYNSHAAINPLFIKGHVFHAAKKKEPL